MKKVNKTNVEVTVIDKDSTPSNWERLEAVIKLSKMSVNAFAKHIGLLRSENIYQIKKGNNGISLDLAKRICSKFPQVDKLWLLTGDGQMFGKDAPAGVWSANGTPNSEAYRGYVAALVLAELVNKENCSNPYYLAVEHAEKLQAALAAPAKKGGAQ